jgi:hypothetical protein
LGAAYSEHRATEEVRPRERSRLWRNPRLQRLMM